MITFEAHAQMYNYLKDKLPRKSNGMRSKIFLQILSRNDYENKLKLIFIFNTLE